MKKIFFLNKTIIYLFICTFCFYIFGLILIHTMLRSDNVVVDIDHLSMEAKEDIKVSIFEEKYGFAYQLCNKILDKFPFIQEVSVTRTSNNYVYVDGRVVMPEFIINQLYGITGDGVMFHLSFLDSIFFDQIKTCTIDDQYWFYDYHACVNNLKKINNMIFDQAFVVLKNKYEGRLIFKKKPSYTVIFNPSYGCNDKLFQMAISLLYNHYGTKNCVGHYNADVRFEKQIVLYQESECI